jgi:hypothetical protein
VKPTPAVTKVILDGKVFYSIADTAKMLGTNAVKVRTLIGQGQLEARQTRFNSKRFVVSGESIIRFKYPDPASGDSKVNESAGHTSRPPLTPTLSPQAGRGSPQRGINPKGRNRG